MSGRRIIMTSSTCSVRVATSAVVAALLAPATALSTNGLERWRNITVTATNFRNAKGMAGIALFASEEGFPPDAQQALRTARVEIAAGEARTTFDRVPPGNYAIAVFHDENDNNRLDANWLGVPREGWGVSNNVRGQRGPPRFDEASFELRDQDITIEVKIGY
jgi:uncharacterized protein (DUF2141 family)